MQRLLNKLLLLPIEPVSQYDTAIEAMEKCQLQLTRCKNVLKTNCNIVKELLNKPKEKSDVSNKRI